MDHENLIKNAFQDEEQRKVVLQLFKHVKDSVEDQLDERLETAGIDKGLFGLDKKALAVAKHNKAYSLVDTLWRNNGRRNKYEDRLSLEDMFKLDNDINGQLRKTFKDAAFTSMDLPLMLPRVIEQQVREAIEPALNLTPLFQTIQFPGRGTSISFPSTGGMYAADVAEGAEYPSRKLEFGGSVTATIGKSGLGVQVTEEAIRYSLFDVISLHARAAGRALARWKEWKAWQEIETNRTLIFDNTSSTVKSTTGRDAAGAHNGTLTAYDFLYAWSQLYNDNGYVPNTLIMNPFGWLVFAQDPLMRSFFMQNGGGQLLKLPQGGQPGRIKEWSRGGLLTTTTPSDPKQVASMFAEPPDLWPGSVRIVVSPFVPYDAATGTTDIVICDSNELGVLVVDENVTMDQWNDPAKDIQHMKFRERYGFATMNGGKAIGYIKGVSIARGFDFAERITVQYSGSELSGSMVQDDHFSNPSFSGVV